MMMPMGNKRGGMNMMGMGGMGMMGGPAAKKFKGNSKGGMGMMPMMPMMGMGMGGGGGGGSGAGVKSQAGSTGEIRFDHATSVMKAINMMQGSVLNGYKLQISKDESSKDGTKIIVANLPPGIEWQELKDHFQKVGDLAHVNIKGGVGGKKQTGEIRYETPEAAQQAMQALNGSTLEGSTISITMDASSKDGTKLTVSDLPPGIGWQELKDHFKQAGLPIAYAGIGTGAGFMNTTGMAEVRYDDPAHTALALQQLNGTVLDGSTIYLRKDENSVDGSKLIVTGLSPTTQWQELKDHFKQCGQVAFCNTAGGGKGKGGMKGCGKGNMMMMPMMMPMMGGMGGMGGMGKMGGMGGCNPMMAMMQMMGGGMW